MNDLKGKYVLVTGASRGIGQAVAGSFLKHGAQVCGVSRDLAKLKEVKSSIESKGLSQGSGNFDFIEADLADPKDIQRIAEHTSQIDILVHNAAFFECLVLDKMTQEVWDRHIQVNLTAPFLLTKLLWNKLKKPQGKESAIIFISSLAGVQNKQKFPGSSAYSASKMGLIGLCEVLALEGKEFNIRANTISPGAVETKMLRDAFPNMKADFTPQNIADMVLYYASEISQPVTGTNVHVSIN